VVRAASTSIGSICCIDPLFLSSLDYSALRLVLKLGEVAEVPLVSLLQDAYANYSTEVRLHVVRT
jgi:hypothetical protein